MKNAHLGNTVYKIRGRLTSPHLAVILNVVYKEGGFVEHSYHFLYFLQHILLHAQPQVHRFYRLIPDLVREDLTFRTCEKISIIFINDRREGQSSKTNSWDVTVESVIILRVFSCSSNSLKYVI